MFKLRPFVRVIGALCVAMMLAGCVVEPAWGPYYHHPHYHYWGY
jgi:hypothetical protein